MLFLFFIRGLGSVERLSDVVFFFSLKFGELLWEVIVALCCAWK